MRGGHVWVTLPPAPMVWRLGFSPTLACSDQHRSPVGSAEASTSSAGVPTPVPTLHVQRAKCTEAERASLTQFQSLDMLQLRPDDFPAFLCDTLGFRLVRRLQPGEAASGFHRSLLVLRKA